MIKLASCQEKLMRGGYKTACGGTLYKCEKCGAVGCAKEGCPNQKFRDGAGSCKICGSSLKKTVY